MTVPSSAAPAPRREFPSSAESIGAYLHVKRATAAVMMSLLWTACSMAGPSAAAPIEERQEFSLRIGESAQTRDGAWQVGFEGVTSDSRCAKGEQCIRAGDATARVWVRQGSAPKETRELHSAQGPAQASRVMERLIRLVRLDPIPITGKAIAKTDYVATLRLSRDSAEEAER